MKSVKILLRQIFTDHNQIEYVDLLMNDLPCIMSSKKLEINEFFTKSTYELTNDEQNYCNIEYPFETDDLPVFSDEHCQYMRFNKFQNFHEYKSELAREVIVRDQKKDAEKNIEVEHTFINF